MDERSTAQTLATVFAMAFVALGVLGFVPGLTTDYGDMSFAGDDSGSELLGVFQVSILHDLLHLLFGIAGLSLAKTSGGAKRYLLGGGALAVLVGLLGLVGGTDWIPTDIPGDVLHLAFGLAMLGAGGAAARSAAG